MKETIFYTREANAIPGVLDSSGRELPIYEMVVLAGVDLFIAPTVIGRLLREGKITYKMKDGIQYFRLNER